MQWSAREGRDRGAAVLSPQTSWLCSLQEALEHEAEGPQLQVGLSPGQGAPAQEPSPRKILHFFPLLSSGSLRNLSQKSSFWVHRVQCRGTESHLSRCPTQLAPPALSQHACPRGMHAIVSCVPGPAFQQDKNRGKKPPRKASLGKVSPGMVLCPNPKASTQGQAAPTECLLLLPGSSCAPASWCPRW